MRTRIIIFSGVGVALASAALALALDSDPVYTKFKAYLEAQEKTSAEIKGYTKKDALDAMTTLTAAERKKFKRGYNGLRQRLANQKREAEEQAVFAALVALINADVKAVHKDVEFELVREGPDDMRVIIYLNGKPEPEEETGLEAEE